MDEELKTARDEARCETVVQTLVDVLRRAEETSEGSYTLYDLIGFMLEDLIRDGVCAACIGETLAAAANEVGVDLSKHMSNDDTVH